MPKASQLQAVKQKFLGRSGLIAFIVLMDMFVPLSIDLYLPALPGLNAYFGSSPSLTNMTLSAFFFFYAVGILLWGPVSDKYGRRPVILAGSLIYIISSVCCSCAKYLCSHWPEPYRVLGWRLVAASLLLKTVLPAKKRNHAGHYPGHFRHCAHTGSCYRFLDFKIYRLAGLLLAFSLYRCYEFAFNYIIYRNFKSGRKIPGEPGRCFWAVICGG